MSKWEIIVDTIHKSISPQLSTVATHLHTSHITIHPRHNLGAMSISVFFSHPSLSPSYDIPTQDHSFQWLEQYFSALFVLGHVKPSPLNDEGHVEWRS
ncbi:hypothetical protein BYT27DRAFT_7247972 [Phlegmacium glaucopus]|nr:hypothetical protein BYT27DRAFT_7247972 [Phlegmacium glaucopus]